jgi:tRNA (cytidine/uridine-2'-O-)-methyltransferase
MENRKKEERERHIVLVHPEIPWNTGCVGRTCLGTGAVLHLVEPLGFSLGAKEVKRAGLDYCPWVEVRVWPDFGAFLEAMKPEAEELFFFTKTASRSFREMGCAGRMFLVFGSESKGLPPEILQRFSGGRFHIPIYSHIRSLNLSTAVGIALFETLREGDVSHGWSEERAAGGAP